MVLGLTTLRVKYAEPDEAEGERGSARRTGGAGTAKLGRRAAANRSPDDPSWTRQVKREEGQSRWIIAVQRERLMPPKLAARKSQLLNMIESQSDIEGAVRLHVGHAA
jgi:hypothetical protein